MFSFFKKLFGNNDEALLNAIKNGAIILDVRSAAEFKQGHAKGSKNIPLNEVKTKISQIQKWNKPVITVCASGTRSGMAKRALKANAVEAYNGGSWSNFPS